MRDRATAALFLALNFTLQFTLSTQEALYLMQIAAIINGFMSD